MWFRGDDLSGVDGRLDHERSDTAASPDEYYTHDGADRQRSHRRPAWLPHRHVYELF